MRDTGLTEPISITPLRLFIRFTPEDGYYEDWWVPTDEMDRAVTLTKELDIEFEAQPERLAPESHACDADIEGCFRRFAMRLHDPVSFEKMKAEFYRDRAA